MGKRNVSQTVMCRAMRSLGEITTVQEGETSAMGSLGCKEVSLPFDVAESPLSTKSYTISNPVTQETG